MPNQSASSYAHLVKSTAAAPSAKGASAKEVDENEKDRAETPPANDKEDGKKAKKAKAKDGEESEEEEEKDDDRDENKKKDAKKAKARAEESGDAVLAATLEERLRCATIFQSKAAAGRPHVAAQFAFHTDLSADSAIAIMEATLTDQPVAAAAPARRSIDERMKHVPSANVGADAPEDQGGAFPTSEDQVGKMSSSQKALAIVNAGRIKRGEEPIKALQ